MAAHESPCKTKLYDRTKERLRVEHHGTPHRGLAHKVVDLTRAGELQRRIEF